MLMLFWNTQLVIHVYLLYGAYIYIIVALEKVLNHKSQNYRFQKSSINIKIWAATCQCVTYVGCVTHWRCPGIPHTDIIHTLTLYHMSHTDTAPLCHTLALFPYVKFTYSEMVPLCHTHHCSLIYHVHICYTGLFPLCHTLTVLPYVMFIYVTH